MSAGCDPIDVSTRANLPDPKWALVVSYPIALPIIRDIQAGADPEPYLTVIMTEIREAILNCRLPKEAP